MRIIARIDIKNEFVIKGIKMEGLRKLGDPNDFAAEYYRQGVDELVFMDVVASLYERRHLYHILTRACEEVFVPVTVGGGIRTLDDIRACLRAGADKTAINTAAVKNPDFITQASLVFGSQCIVGSIEAKRQGGKWEVYCDCGREHTGLDAVEWAKRLEDLGAGEILLTSVDQDGTRKGFDIDLVEKVCQAVSLPVIAAGGAGSQAHVRELCSRAWPGALALASALHYKNTTLAEIRSVLADMGIEVRR